MRLRSLIALLLLGACAQDAPGVETHLINHPVEGEIKIAVWPREEGIYDVAVFNMGVRLFPNPYVLDRRSNRTEAAKEILSDGRCGSKAPILVDTHLENNIQMMRFACRAVHGEPK
ncbi:MAG: hypothetical protein HQL44_12740 [Alphaproteobacteria bacterium]|nr:hypothetical protein [Alphaproteobacteria bacterium]